MPRIRAYGPRAKGRAGQGRAVPKGTEAGAGQGPGQVRGGEGGLPFLEPQALPGGEGLGGVLQRPELVEKHHVKEDQQHQARTETGSSTAMSGNLRETLPAPRERGPHPEAAVPCQRIA